MRNGDARCRVAADVGLRPVHVRLRRPRRTGHEAELAVLSGQPAQPQVTRLNMNEPVTSHQRVT